MCIYIHIYIYVYMYIYIYIYIYLGQGFGGARSANLADSFWSQEAANLFRETITGNVKGRFPNLASAP